MSVAPARRAAALTLKVVAVFAPIGALHAIAAQPAATASTVVTTTTAAASTGRAAVEQGAGSASSSDAAAPMRVDDLPASALRALYPALAADRSTVGESFASPSLGRKASDMRLLDAHYVAFGDTAGNAAGNAAGAVVALLEPIGLVDGYRLIEVGVLAHDGQARWTRLRNLKVRVDDGRTVQPIRLDRPTSAAAAGAEQGTDRPVRIVVALDRAAQRIEHEFAWDGKRLSLVATRYPRASR